MLKVVKSFTDGYECPIVEFVQGSGAIVINYVTRILFIIILSLTFSECTTLVLNIQSVVCKFNIWNPRGTHLL